MSSMIHKFNPHDQELFEKISNIFTQDLQIYLSQFDFADTGRKSVFDELFEMSYYDNTVDYVFIDVDGAFLTIYNDLKNAIKKFHHSFGIHTIPAGEGMFHVAPEIEWIGSDAKILREEADVINSDAEALFSVMKRFIMNGKKRINMQNEKVTKQEVNIYGGIHGNSSIGDGNTMIYNGTDEYKQKIDSLMLEIQDSTLEDKNELLNEIKTCMDNNNKSAVMRTLGGLLTRGSETAGFVASIGAILSL